MLIFGTSTAALRLRQAGATAKECRRVRKEAPWTCLHTCSPWARHDISYVSSRCCCTLSCHHRVLIISISGDSLLVFIWFLTLFLSSRQFVVLSSKLICSDFFTLKTGDFFKFKEHFSIQPPGNAIWCMASTRRPRGEACGVTARPCLLLNSETFLRKIKKRRRRNA